ncbi:MAG TPA: hypothetical protein VLC55_14790 [Burkholderiales bacterium]|nr:hypothetical protein [Burkholderiales bacterium]
MKPLFALVAAVLALGMAAPAAQAQQRLAPDRGAYSAERQQAARISAAQAAEIARRQTGGRVLSIKESRDGYQVKVLTQGGDVRYVFVPASGR